MREWRRPGEQMAHRVIAGDGLEVQDIDWGQVGFETRIALVRGSFVAQDSFIAGQIGQAHPALDSVRGWYSRISRTRARSPTAWAR
jgi:hypothetical protein